MSNAAVEIGAAGIVAAPAIHEKVAAGAWDAYVAGHPDATAYHQRAWLDVIARAFRHEIRPLACIRAGSITGVLPLVIMRSRIFGTFAVSLPFLNGGGVLADEDVSGTALVDAAIRIGGQTRARYVELRHTARRFPQLHERRHRVAMTLRLQDSVDQQWRSLDRKIRNQVRKAEKSSLAAQTGGPELVGDFYRVFARNMRDLGTPVFGRALFEEVLRTFPETTRVVAVYRGELPVAASIVHWRNGWMEVPWASALREFSAAASNMLLYWRMLQLAIECGCRTFEFGRCAPGRGTFHFKRQWGAEPSPLVWEYWMAGGKPAQFDLHSGDSSYGPLTAVWRRLPIGVSTVIGPRIVRGIPC